MCAYPGMVNKFVLSVLFLLFFGISLARADVVINVLAINGKSTAFEKNIEFSLPGEISAADVLDTDGLELDYNVKDAGFFVHGKILLQPKETRTFRIRIRDAWKVPSEKLLAIRNTIDEGFREMGAERSPENGEILRQRLFAKLDFLISEQDQASGDINQRIDEYRNHIQALNEIDASATSIDYWRSDAADDEARKNISYVVEIDNPSEKTRKTKQQHYLPAEVRPEYIVDRQGYEIRYDDKKKQPFLFKEEDLGPKEKKELRFSIKNVWFVHQKDMIYLRERAATIYDTLQSGRFGKTAKVLFDDIVNNMDLIELLQSSDQPSIQQHIGVYRLNLSRFEKSKQDLDDLEKLLSRHRADLEKSRIKNVMQKIRAMKSLARVSEAIFDKKPTVNAAWKLIGGVMLLLALLTVIHFILWFIRSGREKKQSEVKVKGQQEEKAE